MEYKVSVIRSSAFPYQFAFLNVKSGTECLLEDIGRTVVDDEKMFSLEKQGPSDLTLRFARGADASNFITALGAKKHALELLEKTDATALSAAELDLANAGFAEMRVQFSVASMASNNKIER